MKPPMKPAAPHHPLRSHAFVRSSWLGTKAAQFYRVLGWVAPMLLLQACLITRDFRYDGRANVPPSVQSDPTSGTPLGLVVRARDGLSTPDAGVEETAIEFSANIRDPNTEQLLQYKAYLNYDADAIPPIAPVDEGEISGLGGNTPWDRRITFRVERRLLRPAPSCNRVELLVSTSFQRAPRERQPMDPGDLGVGVWWIAREPAGTPEPVDMLGCQTTEPQ